MVPSQVWTFEDCSSCIKIEIAFLVIFHLRGPLKSLNSYFSHNWLILVQFFSPSCEHKVIFTWRGIWGKYPLIYCISCPLSCLDIFILASSVLSFLSKYSAARDSNSPMSFSSSSLLWRFFRRKSFFEEVWNFDSNISSNLFSRNPSKIIFGSSTKNRAGTSLNYLSLKAPLVGEFEPCPCLSILKFVNECLVFWTYWGFLED